MGDKPSKKASSKRTVFIFTISLSVALLAACNLGDSSKHAEIDSKLVELEKLAYSQQNEIDELTSRVQSIDETLSNVGKIVAETTEPTERLLKGSIFIATQGGTSYKLGNIEVFCIDELTFSKLTSQAEVELAETLANINAEVSKKLEIYRPLNEEWSEAVIGFDEAKEKYDKAMSLLKAKVTVLESDTIIVFSYGRESEFESELTALRETRKELMDKSRAVEGIYKNVQKADMELYNQVKSLKAIQENEIEFFFKHLQANDNLARTMTDADGKFEFSVSSSQTYAVCATANRVVGESVETYYWIDFVRPSTSSVQLSNTKLISSIPNFSLPEKYDYPKYSTTFRFLRPEMPEIVISD